MLAKDMALWATVRADYIETGLSYSKLAKKHNVSISTLKKRAADEHWTRSRKARNEPAVEPEIVEEPAGTGTEPEEPTQELVPVGSEAVIVEPVDRQQRFMDATDAMMDRILDALTSPEIISPYSMKLLASALRDLREMQGLNKSALDIEEQRARIEKLRSETRNPETPESSAIVVEFVDSYGMEA